MSDIQSIIDKNKRIRKERWQRLKTEAPGQARFIEQVTALFGKPESLHIAFKGEKFEKWK